MADQMPSMLIPLLRPETIEEHRRRVFGNQKDLVRPNLESSPQYNALSGNNGYSPAFRTVGEEGRYGMEQKARSARPLEYGLRDAGNALLYGMDKTGQATGGRAIQGLLMGRPREVLSAATPFSDEIGLTDPKQKATGEEINRAYGLTDKNSSYQGLKGFLTEALVDPGTMLGGAKLLANPKTYGALGKVGRGVGNFLKEEDTGFSRAVPDLFGVPGTTPSVRPIAGGDDLKAMTIVPRGTSPDDANLIYNDRIGPKYKTTYQDLENKLTPSGRALDFEEKILDGLDTVKQPMLQPLHPPKGGLLGDTSPVPVGENAPWRNLPFPVRTHLRLPVSKMNSEIGDLLNEVPEKSNLIDVIEKSWGPDRFIFRNPGGQILELANSPVLPSRSMDNLVRRPTRSVNIADQIQASHFRPEDIPREFFQSIVDHPDAPDFARRYAETADRLLEQADKHLTDEFAKGVGEVRPGRMFVDTKNMQFRLDNDRVPFVPHEFMKSFEYEPLLRYFDKSLINGKTPTQHAMDVKTNSIWIDPNNPLDSHKKIPGTVRKLIESPRVYKKNRSAGEYPSRYFDPGTTKAKKGVDLSKEPVPFVAPREDAIQVKLLNRWLNREGGRKELGLFDYGRNKDIARAMSFQSIPGEDVLRNGLIHTVARRIGDFTGSPVDELQAKKVASLMSGYAGEPSGSTGAKGLKSGLRDFADAFEMYKETPGGGARPVGNREGRKFAESVLLGNRGQGSVAAQASASANPWSSIVPGTPKYERMLSDELGKMQLFDQQMQSGQNFGYYSPTLNAAGAFQAPAARARMSRPFWETVRHERTHGIMDNAARQGRVNELPFVMRVPTEWRQSNLPLKRGLGLAMDETVAQALGRRDPLGQVARAAGFLLDPSKTGVAVRKSYGPDIAKESQLANAIFQNLYRATDPRTYLVAGAAGYPLLAGRNSGLGDGQLQQVDPRLNQLAALSVGANPKNLANLLDRVRRVGGDSVSHLYGNPIALINPF